MFDIIPAVIIGSIVLLTVLNKKLRHVASFCIILGAKIVWYGLKCIITLLAYIPYSIGVIIGKNKRKKDLLDNPLHRLRNRKIVAVRTTFFILASIFTLSYYIWYMVGVAHGYNSLDTSLLKKGSDALRIERPVQKMNLRG